MTSKYVLDINCWCSACGSGMCINTSIETDEHDMPYVRIVPCQTCLDEAAQAAHREGYAEGLQAGMEYVEDYNFQLGQEEKYARRTC